MTKKVKYHKKRFGHHQEQTSHFLKTYHPYLPLLSIAIAIFFVSFGMFRAQHGVLSYATNLSETRLLEATNQQRINNVKNPLSLNDKLSEAAQAKANDMARRDYWSHNTPDGNPPWTFIDRSGYHYQKAGENLAYGFSTSEGTIAGWMNSQSHRENLLDSAYSEVGFGYAQSSNYQNHGPETIVVALYASPAAVTANIPSPSENSLASSLNTLGASTTKSEPSSRNISFSQLFTGGRLPWINSLLLLSGAIVLAGLVLRHGLSLKRALRKSERFAIHHPLLDVTLLSLLVLGVLLIQSAGSIR